MTMLDVLDAQIMSWNSYIVFQLIDVILGWIDDDA